MRRVVACLALLSTLSLSVPDRLLAQQLDHVVSVEALDQALGQQTNERKANVDEIVKLLRDDAARPYIKWLGGLDRIENAVPTLDDDTLRRLAADSRVASDAIRGGVSRNTVIWIAIIGVLAAVLVGAIATADSLS